MSQKLGRIQSQNSNFLKVHSIFFKTAYFFVNSSHMGTRQGAQPSTKPSLAASDSQISKG